MGVSEKLSDLVHLLNLAGDCVPSPVERAILVIYPPDSELEFRNRFNEYILQLHISYSVLDAETLVFEHLHHEGLMDDAYRIESDDYGELRRYLATQLPKLLLERVVAASEELPAGGAIILKSSTALFPWVSYSDLLQKLPNGFPCRIIIPFPGHEKGSYLHFLDHRDGFNYLARRIS